MRRSFFLIAQIGLVLMTTHTNAFAEPLIVAHRGASQDAPENTLPAFELAWKQGADAIEGDFHLTKDGEIICLHDADTKRVAGTKLIAKDTLLADLRKLDVGSWKGPQFAGIHPPTFKEVVATIPAGKKFYVEIKCGPEIVPKLTAELKVSGLTDQQIVIISFNADVIAAMKKTNPQYNAYWLVSFKENGENGLRPATDDVLDTLKTTHANGLSSGYKLVTADLIDAIHKANYEYHVWTVDDPAIAKQFRKWGAGSITTNAPALIRKELGHDVTVGNVP